MAEQTTRTAGPIFLAADRFAGALRNYHRSEGGAVETRAVEDAEARLDKMDEAYAELLERAKAASDWLHELGKDPAALDAAIRNIDGEG